MAAEIKRKSNRGGRRAGAGRPRKQPTNVAFEGSLTAPGRAYISYATLETRKELGPWNRESLMRKARWLINNFGLAAGAKSSIARHVVGTGIAPQCRSTNIDFAKQAEQMFHDTCGTTAFAFDVAGAVNFYEAQKLIVGEVFTDGDFFGQFSKSQEGRAMCRFIGAEHIGNGNEHKENPLLVDGVRINEFGRPVAYRVLKETNGQDFREVPAEDMLHFRRIDRHGWLRGVSWLHHAVLNLQDMAEIQSYTKASFKLASQIGLVVTSAEAGNIGLGQGLRKVTTANSNNTDGNSILTSESLYSGSGAAQLKPGETIHTIQNELPGDGFDPIMAHIRRDIAVGLGLSDAILWGANGSSGPEVRKDMQQAQVFFSEIQQLLINQFCRKFWTYWLWHEIEAGRLPYVDDWYRVEWQTPQRITIDVGREGALYLKLVDGGLMSTKRYFGSIGLDEEEEEDDMIAAAVRRKKKCEAAGLTVAEVFQPVKSLDIQPPADPIDTRASA